MPSHGWALPAGSACLLFCIHVDCVLAILLMPTCPLVSMLGPHSCWPVCRWPQVCADQCRPGWRLQLLRGSAGGDSSNLLTKGATWTCSMLLDYPNVVSVTLGLCLIGSFISRPCWARYW